MDHPSLEVFRKLAAEGNLIPVRREFVADLETPVSALLKLAPLRPVYLLESAEGGERLGRYSFLGLEPFWQLRAEGGTVTVSAERVIRRESGDPLDILRREMGRYRVAGGEDLPRFYGGAVGYLAYEWVHRLEKLPSLPPDPFPWPEAAFVMARVVVIFDHLRHTVHIVVNQRVGPDLRQSYREAVTTLDEVEARLHAPGPGGQLRPAKKPPGSADQAVTSNLSRERFCRMVEVAKEHIRAGDIFQVVLSQRLQCPLTAPPVEVYRALRSVNPSPYLFYLDLGDRQLAGASPEMLVRVEDGWVETRPIAGTRPRGRDEAEDHRLEAELLVDPKERAEHVMLVDLGRNDVGRVAEPGTVEVREFMTVERYSHVMHLVSAVKGKLAAGLDAFRALASCFPAGTLTGAPKVRAMEIIAELEPVARGPYGGAVGYFGFSGNLDTCITIRTVAMAAGRAMVQAGAGIVADSDPEREYEETLNKARALLVAVRMAEGW